MANRRHQSSPDGRLDHRDRQREYRRRLVALRVTDQGSETRVDFSNLLSPSALVLDRYGSEVFCRICGRGADEVA